jgi:hypothetical protein
VFYYFYRLRWLHNNGEYFSREKKQKVEQYRKQMQDYQRYNMYNRFYRFGDATDIEDQARKDEDRLKKIRR